MSFEDYIKAKEEEKKEFSFDKEERIALFRQYVSEFYKLMEEEWLLGSYNNLNPHFEDIMVHEELLGEYAMPSLVLRLGNDRIQFIPVGTILIGTPGRIDMICNGRKAMFILTGEKARNPKAHLMIRGENEKPVKRDYGKLVWKLVDERGMMSFVDLTPESVQQLIMDIVG